MRILVITATVCCLCLLGIALALWWTMQGRPRRDRRPAPAEGMERERSKPHPRMDLAAGIVPGEQTVRPRLRYGVPQAANTSAEQIGRPVRPDWAYYKQDLGDLSDPDLRRGPGPHGTLSVPER